MNRRIMPGAGMGLGLAVAAAMSLGVGYLFSEPWQQERRSRRRVRTDAEALIASMVLDGTAAKATYTSEKPLTKRQRRRLRGKA